MASFRVRLHRIISWMLVAFFFTTVFTGYSMTQNWFNDKYLLSQLHRISEWFFVGLLLYHLIYTMFFTKIRSKKLITKLREKRGVEINSLRLIQKIASWGIMITVLLIILSGLNGYVWYANTFGEIIPFSWHRVLDLVLNIFIIIHIAIGLKFLTIRKKLRKQWVNYAIATLTILLLIGAIYLQIPKNHTGIPTNPGTPSEEGMVKITIEGSQYEFNPLNVTTTRPDIFKGIQFSMFDVIVHLDELGKVNLDYHFDVSMNTFVIDSLNGKTNWWYRTWYSGGWPEKNAFRMDHYPWKFGTTLSFYQEREAYLEDVYTAFAEEIVRKENNGGKVIIPEIIINGNTVFKTFTDIEITPHNLRDDIFQNGVITAIDVIISLGELGLISYELQWYDSIGTANYVRNYWVNGIEEDLAAGTCGWVYESGSRAFPGFQGNHIHLPQDSRVINSAEYYKTFWICL